MGPSRKPDAATVEALARLALEAKRRGLRLRIHDAPAELVELIDFMGLAKALGVKPRR